MEDIKTTRKQKDGIILSVSSIGEKLGKTFFIRNFASILAEQGKKVLILDFSKSNEDYIHFFNKPTVNIQDLKKVYDKQITLQSSKIIYSKNRAITIISKKNKKELPQEFYQTIFNTLKKTYDYILIENGNSNEEVKNFINQNISIIKNQKDISKLDKKDKIIINFSEESHTLDEYYEESHDFIGVINKFSEEERECISKPINKKPYLDYCYILEKIANRLINKEKIEKLSTLSINRKVKIDILYNYFDVIKKI